MGNLQLHKHSPTKRAPDAGESGAIPSIFLRLSIFPVGRRSAARPSAGNANRWAAVRQKVKQNIVYFSIVDTQKRLIRKYKDERIRLG